MNSLVPKWNWIHWSHLWVGKVPMSRTYPHSQGKWAKQRGSQQQNIPQRMTVNRCKLSQSKSNTFWPPWSQPYTWSCWPSYSYHTSCKLQCRKRHCNFVLPRNWQFSTCTGCLNYWRIILGLSTLCPLEKALHVGWATLHAHWLEETKNAKELLLSLIQHSC